MLKIYTGKNSALHDALTQRLSEVKESESCTEHVIVPRQITLLTERMLFDRLHIEGSFRLQIMSPARFCISVFDETGSRDSVRVDDRGRVMLTRRLLREKRDQLGIYRGAERRRGFAQKCAEQLELFMQGGLTGDDLRACIGGVSSADLKLKDLSCLLDDYTALMTERYSDSETDLRRAAEAIRGRRPEFIRNARFFFFGFDVMPSTLTELIVSVAGASGMDAELFFPLKDDETAPDSECYRPIRNTVKRLTEVCREYGVAVSSERTGAAGRERGADIEVLERNLFAFAAPVELPVENVHFRYAANPREECMYAAAFARETVRKTNCRWSDIQLLCGDLQGYGHTLKEAFDLYDVPLCLETGRSVSRMATAECLLTALRAVGSEFRTEDVLTLARTGYMPLDGDAADRLANYAVRYGIDRSRWERPFNRGREEEYTGVEALRLQVMAPLQALKDDLRKAQDLRSQLGAISAFMKNINAFEHSELLRKELIEAGKRTQAGDLAQAWNRIIGAMSQMQALMGEDKMDIDDLVDTLSEALDAEQIKALPQSGDAVYAQSAGRMLHQRARLVMFIGMTDHSSTGGNELLTDAQKRAICDKTKSYLGPTEEDTSLLRRFYLKSALGMVDETVLVSYPISGSDDSAVRPDITVSLMANLFCVRDEKGELKGLKPTSIRDDENAKRLLYCAPKAAAALLAGAVSDLRDNRWSADQDDARLKVDREGAAAMRAAAENGMPAELSGCVSGAAEAVGDRIDPGTAAAVYRDLSRISITRLEKFANCPYSFFMQYGLAPEKIEEPEMGADKKGEFLHLAMLRFLRKYGAQLSNMTNIEAVQGMSDIADEIRAAMMEKSPAEEPGYIRREMRGLREIAFIAEDDAGIQAELDFYRDIACESAAALAEQMRGTLFTPTDLERNFGPDDDLKIDGTLIEGKIDRIDTCAEPQALRIIDYKSSGKKIDYGELYDGLSLQLPIYLGAAERSRAGDSAGVYYFPLVDGIIENQDNNAEKIEEARRKAFKMNGLLPAEKKIIDAMAPDGDGGLGSLYKKGTDELKSAYNCAEQSDFDRLIRHSVQKAKEQLTAIRGGTIDISPVEYAQKSACTYCDYKAACLYDATGGSQGRKKTSMSWADLREHLRREDQEAEESQNGQEE